MQAVSMCTFCEGKYMLMDLDRILGQWLGIRFSVLGFMGRDFE